MNLNQLKYFYTVCTYGSLSDAAEILHISQPSLSSAIKALESEFGVLLFQRNHKGMMLTQDGNILFERCTDILSRTEQLENIMKDLGKERTKLRLGVPPMIGSIILPRIYRDFNKLYPHISLEIFEDGRKGLLEKLSENHLDMIFSLHKNSLDEKFSSKKVAELEIVCCTTKNDSISKFKAITPLDIKNVPLVLFEDGFFQTAEIKKWFACENVTPNILIQTKQFSTMLTLISNNISIGFAFKNLIEMNDDLIAIPLDPPISVEASLIWKKDSYFFDSMKKFSQYIKSNNPFEIIS